MTELDFPPAPPSAPASGRRISALLVVMILVALAGVGLTGYGVVTLFGYKSVLVPGRAMGTSVPAGTSVIYRVDATTELHRGDLIVFEASAMDSLMHGRLLKRVVGIGGDTVTCCDAQERIQVNGKPVTEPYVQADEPPLRLRPFSVVVPPDTVFVMGDLRDNSDDSRFHTENGHSGAIPRSKVDGVVVGQGSVFSLRTLNPTTVFVDAGLPGVSSADSTYGNARWFVAGGVALFLLGVIGVIVSAARSAGKRRRAAAVPLMR